jgi:hypothetical protein
MVARKDRDKSTSTEERGNDLQRECGHRNPLSASSPPATSPQLHLTANTPSRIYLSGATTMSFTNGALDSSPIAIPKIQPKPSEATIRPRGVKRTASSAALLTPPRGDKRRQRVKRIDESDEDVDDDAMRTPVSSPPRRSAHSTSGPRKQPTRDAKTASPYSDVSMKSPRSPVAKTESATRAAPMTPPRSRRQQRPPTPHTPRHDDKNPLDLENPFVVTPPNIRRPRRARTPDEWADSDDEEVVPRNAKAVNIRTLPKDSNGERPVMTYV